jgi:arylsulfatase A-like enzyme
VFVSRVRLLRPLVSLLVPLLLLACGETVERPNVLLITIDTLRADYVSAYGFELRTTPELDALARRGALFTRAIAASTTTAPSHASIMTGLYPRQHSIGASNGETRLTGTPTLATHFKAAGYATGAFVGNIVLKRRIGLDQGFDVYDDELPTQELNRPLIFERIASATTARALEWLRDVDGPFFLWVHYQDPHGPYTPPEEYVGRFQVPPVGRDDPLPVVQSPFGYRGIPAYQVLPNQFRPSVYRSRYADEIFFADESIGRLLAAVESRSETAPIVLATADHGESLGERERYFSHGTQARRGQDERHVRVNSIASHVDVAPTLVALADLPRLHDVAGVDVSLPFRKPGPIAGRRVFCDVGLELVAYDRAGFTRVGPTLPTWNGGAAPPESSWQHFDWNGNRRQPPRQMLDSIRGYLRIVPRIETAPPTSKDDLERLRALGYVE